MDEFIDVLHKNKIIRTLECSANFGHFSEMLILDHETFYYLLISNMDIKWALPYTNSEASNLNPGRYVLP